MLKVGKTKWLVTKSMERNLKLGFICRLPTTYYSIMHIMKRRLNMVGQPLMITGGNTAINVAKKGQTIDTIYSMTNPKY